MDKEPVLSTIFAKFTGDEILEEMGRLLYSLLSVFTTNGYQVQLYDNIDFSKLDKYGQLVSAMTNLSLVAKVPDNPTRMFYLFDRDDKSCSHLRWRKKIQVKFDVFSIYRISDPLIMPYPVHPFHSGPDLPERLEMLRLNKKKVRIFFSGDTKGYTKNRIHYPTTKLPRLEVIDTILAKLGGETSYLTDEAALTSLFAGDYVNNCVIVDSNRLRVNPADWLPYLSQSDFFICPPGYCMPMCHNAVEAMAVGSIPIINYPEWFSPTLQHMENCVVFGDKQDLVTKIQTVLALPQQKVSAMRNSVLDYYESHLNPRTFIRQIESRKGKKITVLMITDKNTVRNASKLNARSILISGKPALANLSLFGFLGRLLR
jgi:hypothetical protein